MTEPQLFNFETKRNSSRLSLTRRGVCICNLYNLRVPFCELQWSHLQWCRSQRHNLGSWGGHLPSCLPETFLEWDFWILKHNWQIDNTIYIQFSTIRQVCWNLMICLHSTWNQVIFKIIWILRARSAMTLEKNLPWPQATQGLFRDSDSQTPKELQVILEDLCLNQGITAPRQLSRISLVLAVF